MARLDPLLWLPFLLPGVLLGIGLITIFNRPWAALFYQSTGIVVLAFVMRYLGFGRTVVAQACQTVDPDLVDAARLEGANRWQILRHVDWPQIAPQIAAAWYIVFLLCLWDVESMILVVPPGGETLALRTFNLLHYGHNGQVNALCLTLMALALAPGILWRALSVLRSAATPARMAAITLLFSVAGLSFGCSPPHAATEAPVQSRIFGQVQIIGSRGVGVGQLNKPRSVAVDRQDNLYVVDMTGRVQKFTSNGVFVLLWQMPQTDLGKPKGMCRDGQGNIVVLEPHYSRLNHFSPAGQLLCQWGQRGTNCGQFSLPRAVAVDSHNEIFVSEYQGIERVQKFGFPDTQSAILPPQQATAPASPAHDSPARSVSPPRWLATFGQAGTGPGEFNRPEGLCVDAQDRLYVADSCNHRIQVFSSDGKFLRAYGRPGKGIGELSYPYDICVDKEGRQYVCEFGNSRIQVFDAQDQPLEIIGGPGAEPGGFSNPWSLALDSKGNLYVADSQNHRVQKFIRRER
jgi:DNA-binding beta-propeller fold protein YncE/ABC-type molybdate transport system permease subunit